MDAFVIIWSPTHRLSLLFFVSSYCMVQLIVDWLELLARIKLHEILILMSCSALFRWYHSRADDFFGHYIYTYTDTQLEQSNILTAIPRSILFLCNPNIINIMLLVVWIRYLSSNLLLPIHISPSQVKRGIHTSSLVATGLPSGFRYCTGDMMLLRFNYTILCTIKFFECYLLPRNLLSLRLTQLNWIRYKHQIYY